MTASVQRQARAVVTVTVSDARTGKSEALTCTPEHPFFVAGRGWVEAGSLGIGASLVSRAGPALTVQALAWHRGQSEEKAGAGIPQSTLYTVYNLTVEGDHTFFVGSVGGGTWVHNVDCFSMGDRLKEFFGRLHQAPNANTPEEALGQVRETLNGVEDEMSGIPHDPVPGRGVQNGRMYPPFNDSVINNADGSLSAMTKGHRLEFGSDGSINIFPRSGGESVFSKLGGGGL